MRPLTLLVCWFLVKDRKWSKVATHNGLLTLHANSHTIEEGDEEERQREGGSVERIQNGQVFIRLFLARFGVRLFDSSVH